MENSHEQELEDLELFQKRVSERLSELIPTVTPVPHNNNNNNNTNNTNDPPSSTSPDSPSAHHLGSPTPPTTTLLSISWFWKLLNMFLCCEVEFKAVVVVGRDAPQFFKPPLDRRIPKILRGGGE